TEILRLTESIHRETGQNRDAASATGYKVDWSLTNRFTRCGFGQVQTTLLARRLEIVNIGSGRTPCSQIQKDNEHVSLRGFANPFRRDSGCQRTGQQASAVAAVCDRRRADRLCSTAHRAPLQKSVKFPG